MRITRVIREFVEKEIRNKADAKRDELYKEYNERLKKCENEIIEYLEGIFTVTMYPQINMILRKHGMDATNEERMIDYANYVRRNLYINNKEEFAKISEESWKLYKKEDEAIQNLLLDLELGANKSELKGMLEKINFQFMTALQLK